jgi:hypothetical protein
MERIDLYYHLDAELMNDKISHYRYAVLMPCLLLITRNSVVDNVD